jgi:hypothetical protein|nr:MAG TPA: hypothetical protein [Bacteriophage sp.]
MALRSDFKDSVLKDTTGNKKYKMITNSDNTVSFVDVTEYSQEGSNYGAKEVNEEREAINSVIVPETKAVGSGCYITEVGAVTWFRVVLKMRTEVPEGREYLLGIVPAPMFEVSRKIYIDNNFGFIFDIVSNGQATITPFGGDITAGTEIYVSEFFIKAQE